MRIWPSDDPGVTVVYCKNLKMNAEKTKYMIAKSVRKEMKGNIVLKCVDGTELERVKIMKYFGIIIDDKLRFKDYCEYIGDFENY